MEDWIQRLFLTVLLTLPAIAQAATDPDELELEPLVVREPELREVDIDRIDTEDFEIGVYGGLMSVQNW